VLAYELIVGRCPFEQETRSATYESIMYREVKFPPHVSDEARDFISSALSKTARARPSVRELLHHPWIVKFAQGAEQEGCGGVEEEEEELVDEAAAAAAPAEQKEQHAMGLALDGQQQGETEQQQRAATHLQRISSSAGSTAARQAVTTTTTTTDGSSSQDSSSLVAVITDTLIESPCTAAGTAPGHDVAALSASPAAAGVPEHYNQHPDAALLSPTPSSPPAAVEPNPHATVHFAAATPPALQTPAPAKLPPGPKAPVPLLRLTDSINSARSSGTGVVVPGHAHGLHRKIYHDADRRLTLGHDNMSWEDFISTKPLQLQHLNGAEAGAGGSSPVLVADETATDAESLAVIAPLLMSRSGSPASLTAASNYASGAAEDYSAGAWGSSGTNAAASFPMAGAAGAAQGSQTPPVSSSRSRLGSSLNLAALAAGSGAVSSSGTPTASHVGPVQLASRSGSFVNLARLVRGSGWDSPTAIVAGAASPPHSATAAADRLSHKQPPRSSTASTTVTPRRGSSQTGAAPAAAVAVDHASAAAAAAILRSKSEAAELSAWLEDSIATEAASSDTAEDLDLTSWPSFMSGGGGGGGAGSGGHHVHSGAQSRSASFTAGVLSHAGAKAPSAGVLAAARLRGSSSLLSSPRGGSGVGTSAAGTPRGVSFSAAGSPSGAAAAPGALWSPKPAAAAAAGGSGVVRSSKSLTAQAMVGGRLV